MSDTLCSRGVLLVFCKCLVLCDGAESSVCFLVPVSLASSVPHKVTSHALCTTLQSMELHRSLFAAGLRRVKVYSVL